MNSTSALSRCNSTVFVTLSGGLGNQMFQYATARSLALSRNANLILDNSSGFARDVEYRREYQLCKLSIKGKLASPIDRIPLYIHKVWRKLKIKSPQMIELGLLNSYLYDPFYHWSPRISEVCLGRNVWLIGYWQSSLYFSHYTDLLLNELLPKPSSSKLFQNAAKLINDSESVALGIRFYEESSASNNQSSTSSLKSPAQVQAQINRVFDQCPSAKLFVFCTHKSAFFSQLVLPENTVYLTSDIGYTDPLGTLWLLSLCKHHVFTNSSFYWWGAWLSQHSHRPDRQLIIAADNFFNSDCPCPHWQTF